MKFSLFETTESDLWCFSADWADEDEDERHYSDIKLLTDISHLIVAGTVQLICVMFYIVLKISRIY